MTHWYLRRHSAYPDTIMLVVEEDAATKRGCSIAVASRKEARALLPILHQALHERIKSATAQLQRVWDPVEDDGARG